MNSAGPDNENRKLEEPDMPSTRSLCNLIVDELVVYTNFFVRIPLGKQRKSLLDLLIEMSDDVQNDLTDQDLREEIDTFAFGV